MLGCLGLLVAADAAAGLLPRPEGDGGILPVERAFELRPASWEGGTLTLGLDIAPGCYLYRNKLVVEAIEPASYGLGPASLPAGEPYFDEHFGKVAIFRHAVEIGFTPKSGAPRKLRVRFQGCAQDKVCYPMQTRVIDVPSP